MFKRLALATTVFACLGSVSPAATVAVAAYSQATTVSQALPPLFNSESAAQAHCSRNVVVWLNIPSGIYHYKGERWYGRTKHGAYACEKEAIAAGDRASENGQ
jgi:hypothetical protein